MTPCFHSKLSAWVLHVASIDHVYTHTHKVRWKESHPPFNSKCYKLWRVLNGTSIVHSHCEMMHSVQSLAFLDAASYYPVRCLTCDINIQMTRKFLCKSVFFIAQFCIYHFRGSVIISSCSRSFYLLYSSGWLLMLSLYYFLKWVFYCWFISWAEHCF